MAYDFGSNTLGIKNPFKPEGWIKAGAGLIVIILGVIPLLGVSQDLQTDATRAWIRAVAGFLLLAWGFKHTGAGLFQLFRYFVGRSVPSSLAFNHSPSEKDTAATEKPFLVYESHTLESMLMGRKNSSFAEPVGWLARLIHSLLPKLIFMPHPIRNYAQELCNLLATSVVALSAFAVAYFVAVSGLVGNAGTVITPVLSILLLTYLILVWRASAAQLSSASNRKLAAKDVTSLSKLFGFAIITPILIGFLFSKLSADSASHVQHWVTYLGAFNAWFNLLVLFLASGIVIALSWFLLQERFTRVDPITDVSEYRDNMQESVHPTEIFINIENSVLANRRFKEIPNRIYHSFDPTLEEQSQGKGSFRGQLLIETQPEFIETPFSDPFKLTRLLATLCSQLFVVAAAALFLWLSGSIADTVYYAIHNLPAASRAAGAQQVISYGAFSALISGVLTLLFCWQTCLAAGKILSAGSHLFWAEIQFNSLLMWMKAEGTFTESKISTGMSIHDSTRSENVLVRSSISPWIITSRIVTSTFATSGSQNLEMPRFILAMHKNPAELEQIVDEIKHFLRGRETIASITNEKDLRNAEVIYQVNQTSRLGTPINAEQKRLEEQAAGQSRESADE